MVRIIVDDDRAVGFAHPGEAAFYTVEAIEPLEDRIVAQPHLQRHRDRSKRILDIVAPGHRHFDALYGAALAVAGEHERIEATAAGDVRDVVSPNVGQRGKAVGDDAPVADPADD